MVSIKCICSHRIEVTDNTWTLGFKGQQKKGKSREILIISQIKFTLALQK